MPKLSHLALALGLLLPTAALMPQAYSQTADASELCQDCVRIGILPLKYEGDQQKIQLYAQGTQDSLIHALSSGRSLVVVDRTRTNEVIKEIAFQQSLYVDEKTQVELGKILGVDYLYTGSIQEVGGRLRIFIERIHVATGQVNAIAQVTGPVQDLFALQDQIAQKILEQAQGSVTAQEQQALHQKMKQTSSLSAYEAYVHGLELQNNQQFSQAVFEYSRAIAFDPNYAVAYYNRGLAYDSLQAYAKALADYNRALKLVPNLANAYVSRGNSYSYAQQYAKAIADYTRAIALDPRSTLAYNNRGVAYKHLQEYDKALADYASVIELDPKDAEAYYNRGNVYKQIQQYAKALADYNRALELNPKLAVAYQNRANVYAQLDLRKQALADWKTACQLGMTSTCTWLAENGD